MLASRRLASALPRVPVRAMSSAVRKHEFLVIVPDKPGSKDKRLEVRPLHLKNATPNIESGTWQMGGPILKSLPKDDDPKGFDFLGSTLICVAESEEEVLNQLRADVYNPEGVWDVEKAQIYPFRCTFRNP